MTEIKATDPRILLDGLDNLPTLSPVVNKVMGLINDSESTSKQISEFIQNDASLTSRILKVVNSAFYGFNQKITTVSHAVSLLGMDTLKSIVLSTSIIDMMAQNSSAISDLKRLWERSLFSAVSGRKMAREMDYNNPEETFIACLLMDVGMLAQLYFYGEIYEQIISNELHRGDDIVVAESRDLEFSHERLGEAMLQKWGLPELFYIPVRYHHDLTGYDKEPEETQLLSQLVHLARLAGGIFFSPKSGNAIRDFKTVSNSLFEMGPDQVDGFFRSIKEEAFEAAQQYGFSISHLRSYTEILDEANQELTELNVTYERMNRELQKAKQEAEKLSRKLRKANETLQSLANVDDLTGLYNRRYHDDYLKREFERSKRYQRPFSYALIDIDHFKSINDNYGHQQGDIILKELGRKLRSMIRSSDMAFRYGGEEIAVVLPETDFAGAKNIGERILKDIERHEFPHKPGEPMHITVSLGISSYGESDDFETLHEFVKKADECLYRAKKEGRNRICF